MPGQTGVCSRMSETYRDQHDPAKRISLPTAREREGLRVVAQLGTSERVETIVVEAERSRQALVNLLSLVDAGSAERWADRLTHEQGSLGRVLAASPEALGRVVDPTAVRALGAARDVMLEVLRREIEARPVVQNARAVLDYLHATMAYRMEESARVLHLNSKDILVRDEQVSEGTIDQTALYVREVARRALELGSAAVVLVHNHPSGDPAPSRQDIAMTREMVAALKPLGIRVHDHLIIGATGHASLRQMGIV